MKTLLSALMVVMTVSTVANAKTVLFQCAGDDVQARGVRVNVIENNGLLRANLIFGTTVSGTMYGLKEVQDGYIGQIKNKPTYSMELKISNIQARNSNIDGYKASLKAVYPTLLNSKGFDVVNVDFVCGEKISDRWN